MKLSGILKALPDPGVRFVGTVDPSARPHGVTVDADDPDINSIHYQSQTVQPGGLFVALPGLTADGHDYIHDALAKGAVAIVTQHTRYDGDDPERFLCNGRPVPDGFWHIHVDDSRRALAPISAAFYGDPSETMCIIGITGTNGKTTTACLIESILITTGMRPGVIGTLNYRYGDRIFDNPMTTPEAPDLQKILAEMQVAGISHVVMEVSSHGIDRHRVDNCYFDVGVFTNLSQDHLDYHGDMDTYWSCKKGWLTDHLRTGPKRDRATVVLNCDDARGKELSERLLNQGSQLPCITTGRAENAQVRPEDLAFDLKGIGGTIATPKGPFEFKSALVGEHNIDNILSAVGAGVAMGIPPENVKAGIEAVSIVSGRLEPIANDRGRFVYVDYAHTPDALAHVLTALRSLASGRLICIFGCGGDRDTDKRWQMGEISVGRCDLSIITSDNPRTEDPGMIIDQICEGADRVSSYRYQPAELAKGFISRGYAVEPDRKMAIVLGIAASRSGDTILIAGKGNETYQIIGERRYPFDDREEARKALAVDDGSCQPSGFTG
ncbi:MAG: UDP-N-acetylmuramoyl-L-alanyl-D-glutamate--2,6-diaminopimelate ligase [Desulfobacterales bacterium]